MRVELNEKELGSGLEIGVVGFAADSAAVAYQPTQVYLEVVNNELRVHIWNGGEDPAYSISIPRVSEVSA